MSDLKQQLTELLSKGNKLGAIRLLREQRGLGLAEAKAALEGFESMGDLPPERPAPAELPEDVRELAVQGQVLEAIKVLRTQTGMGLAEAKALVDPLVGPSKKSGCGAALGFMVFACAAWIASA